MGDYQAAKAALNDALKINPRYPDALCDLGMPPSLELHSGLTANYLGGLTKHVEPLCWPNVVRVQLLGRKIYFLPEKSFNVRAREYILFENVLS